MSQSRASPDLHVKKEENGWTVGRMGPGNAAGTSVLRYLI